MNEEMGLDKHRHQEEEALGTRGRGSLHAGLRWEVVYLEKGGREGEKIRSER